MRAKNLVPLIVNSHLKMTAKRKNFLFFLRKNVVFKELENFLAIQFSREHVQKKC